MTEKQRALMDEYLPMLPEEYRAMMNELAEYAVSLGFNPVRCKTAMMTIDFVKPKIKGKLMKMGVKEGRHGEFRFGERERPDLRLKFYAAEGYLDNPILSYGLKNTIEDFGGRYTGCYGCGRCGGDPQGYTYVYPDGKRVFRCGTELISVFDFTEADLPELKRVIREQAEYIAISN